MSHVSSRMQSLGQYPNLLHLKHTNGVRRSSNGDMIIHPPLRSHRLTEQLYASSFTVTLLTTGAYYPLGLGRLSHRIVHTSTLFSILKRSMADLLTLPLSSSIANATSIQSALTICHLGPTSLASGMCGSSHSTVVYWNAASILVHREFDHTRIFVRPSYMKVLN